MRRSEIALAKVDTGQVDDPMPQSEIAILRGEVQGLTTAIKKISDRRCVADYRLRASARALLGLSVNDVEMAVLNWDHLLESEKKVDDNT